MNDKLAVNFVAVTKPKERSPILSRRSKLISYLDKQLAKVHQFKAGSNASGAQFWLDQSGAIFLQVNYGKYPLEVQKGKTTVKCASFDELETTINRLKDMARVGDFDEPLHKAALAIRTKFKRKQ
jgi:hypothetical protein